MKKILIFLLLLSGLNCAAFAGDIENYKQYTIIKTTNNYVPLRDGASDNAKRFSHLEKGVKIFADEYKNNFYRVDLGLDKYYWINKKDVDVTSKAIKKEPSKIDEIKIYENPKYYIAKIKLTEIPPYNEIETSKNSVDFIIYDSILDKENLIQTIETNADFKISKDEFNNLKISYFSNLPLSGHNVQIDGNNLLLKVRKPFLYGENKPFENLTIIVDPGHGGSESGAVAYNLKEKDINLQISKKLKKSLQKNGAKVYLTRETDEYKGLYERVDFAKRKNADIFISIHQNSLPDRKKVNEKHGTGVYYYNKEAYELSKEIKNSLVKKTGFRDDGVNLASFAVIRTTDPVSVLVECGYIIHPKEVKKISDPNFQKKIAKAISVGIKNYLKNNF